MASSMSTVWGTYHSLYALKHSNGLAISLEGNKEINEAQKKLAQTEGVYCESASASGLAGLKRLLAEGKIKKGEKIVLLITASGVKDTAVTASYLPRVPESNGEMENVFTILKDIYHLQDTI